MHFKLKKTAILTLESQGNVLHLKGVQNVKSHLFSFSLKHQNKRIEDKAYSESTSNLVPLPVSIVTLLYKTKKKKVH